MQIEDGFWVPESGCLIPAAKRPLTLYPGPWTLDPDSGNIFVLECEIPLIFVLFLGIGTIP
jgi:hypothetical protein